MPPTIRDHFVRISSKRLSFNLPWHESTELQQKQTHGQIWRPDYTLRIFLQAPGVHHVPDSCPEFSYSVSVFRMQLSDEIS